MRFDIRISIFPATRVSGDFYDADASAQMINNLMGTDDS